MKSQSFQFRAFGALACVLSVFDPRSVALAQGSLTPPGAPEPTMKSLDAIEPRTPVSSAPYTIMSSGSYYLTTNLNVTTGDAITIGANGVVLDLNGFTLSSTDPNNTGSGVVLGGSGRRQNITILNGFIVGSVGYGGGFFGSGFASGVLYTGPAPYNIRVAGVSVSGCLLYGIYLGTGFSTVVESCTVQTVGGYGVVAAAVSHSAAYQCGDTAIFANSASDSYGYTLGGGDGLSAATANNCYGYCLGNGNGLSATTANNSYGYCMGNAVGLRATTANNCYGYCTGSGVGVAGLVAGAANNCYGYCTGSGGFGRGLDADVALNCEGEGSVGDGLYAAYSATGCYGRSFSGGFGLNAATANNCFGRSDSGLGLSASAAIGCFCISASGTGLSASIANSCSASSVDPATAKFNMP